MDRPNIEYQCLLGIYDPLGRSFHQDYKIGDAFRPSPSTPSDQEGCLGSTDIFEFGSGESPKAILIARPFRENSYFRYEHTVNGASVVSYGSLYDAQLETPRLFWLPSDVTRVVFNIRVEDMGYEPSWYDQNEPIPEACDRDFINNIGLYFMYDAKPYYSKLELVKEPDTQASSGRFLRDKVTTDLTFRGRDFDTIVSQSVSEYSVCAVAFYEMFEENPQQDYMAACCYFNRADAEVNFSECYVKPNLKTLDNYTWLLDKYAVEKNIVGIQASTQRVKIYIPPIIQVYAYGSNAVTNICNDTSWEVEVSDPDISAVDLRRMGFKEVGRQKLISEAHTLGAHPYNALMLVGKPAGYPFVPLANISYRFNASNGEYMFGDTANYDIEPTDDWPYDVFAFRLRDGAIEFYSTETGEVASRTAYSGSWPNVSALQVLSENFLKKHNIWWDLEAISGNGVGYRSNVYVRVLYHSETESDRIAIGDFSTPSKWYNKIAFAQSYGSAAVSSEQYIRDELAEILLFSETNYVTGRPTEFGNYQPDLYYTNETLPLNSHLSGLRPLPVAKSWWGDYSYWIDLVGGNVNSILGNLTTGVVVNDCYKLDSVIARLLNKYGLSFKFEPNASSSGLIYGNSALPNYLKCRFVYLVPATNITRGKYTQAAQKAMLSLKDLLDEICSVCNAGWHIDKYGLHIEGNEWYDSGRTYNGINYSPDFNFESVVDEFNATNTLYGQLSSSPSTDSLWKTLSMMSNDRATKHFSDTEMSAKAVFCSKSENISTRFSYDLLEAIAVDDGVSEDSIICLGSYFNGILPVGSLEHVGICSTSIYDVNVNGVSEPVQSLIMNRAFSWPYIKGRHVFGLPADKSLIDFGWLQSAEYFSTLAKAYTRPHRSIKIRMPIVSSLYARSWMLVKTTLGYGVVSRIDVDLITRVADITVDILEYNL